MNVLTSAWMIARKDLRVFFRDRTGMLLGFLLPISLITVFGYVMKLAFGGFAGDGMPRAVLWVADQDDSESSRRFLQELRDSKMIRVRPRTNGEPQDAAQVRKLITDGEAHHALIIESGFGAAMVAGELPQLTMVRDPGRTMEDRIIRIGLMQTFMAASEGKLWPVAMGNMMRKMGMEENRVTVLVSVSRSVQAILTGFATNPSKAADSNAASPNDDDELTANGDDADAAAEPETKDPVFGFSNFMEEMVPLDLVDIVPPGRSRNLSYQLAQSVSGVTVMMLMFGLMACGSMLLQEREGGTLQRLLVASVPRSSILWAKFLFSAVVGMIQLTVLFTYGNLVFKIEAFRDPVTLLVLSLTWTATATSFGMLIAAWARTTKQAEGVATLLILVMAALGGCWFPIQMVDLPLAAEIVTRSTLTYWAMSGYQGMFWEQWSWTHPKMLTAIGVQWGFAAAASTLALWLFRRRYVAG